MSKKSARPHPSHRPADTVAWNSRDLTAEWARWAGETRHQFTPPTDAVFQLVGCRDDDGTSAGQWFETRAGTRRGYYWDRVTDGPIGPVIHVPDHAVQYKRTDLWIAAHQAGASVKARQLAGYGMSSGPPLQVAA